MSKIKIHIRNNHWKVGFLPCDLEGEKHSTITKEEFEIGLSQYPEIKDKIEYLVDWDNDNYLSSMKDADILLGWQFPTKNIKSIADLHNVLRTKVLNLLFKLSFKKVQSIDKGRADRKKLTRKKNKIFKPLTPIQYKYCDVFRRLGFPVDLVNHEYPVKPYLDNHSEEQKLLSLCQNKQIIGVAPFASYKGKSYPLDLMQNVIAYLQINYNVYLFGGGDNELKQIEIWDKAYENVYDVSKRFSLSQQINIINYIDLMISMDSANGHLAANCGIPVLTIWGMTHPFCGFTPFDQSTENSIMIDRNLYPSIPTSVFGNKIPKGYESAFRSIKPKEIIEKALKILDDTTPHHN